MTQTAGVRRKTLRKPDRAQWSDLLRGVAIVLVIVYHSTDQTAPYPPDHWLVVFNDALTPFRMPTLMFLSGFFLPRSLAKPPARFVKGKLAQIGWPYVLWSLIFLLTPAVLGTAEEAFSPLSLTQIVNLYQPANLWYLYYLLLFYLVALVLPYRARIALIPLVWIAASLVPDLYIRRILFLAGFFFLGELAARNSDRFDALLRRRTLVAVCVVAGGALLVASGTGIFPDYFGPGAPFVVAAITASIALARKIAGNQGTHTLQWIGRNSLVFYASHYTAIRLGNYLSEKLDVDVSILIVVICVGAALTFGALLAFLRERFEVVNWLFVFPSPRTRWGRVVATATAVVVVVLLAVVVAWRNLPFSTSKAVEQSAASIEQTTTPTGDERVIITPHAPNGDAVVYAHGNGQSEEEVLRGRNVAPITAALLDAGYVVAASTAGDRAWGNADSVAEYEALVADLRANLSVGRVFVLAESMGALSAFQLEDVDAIAAVYPVCDLSSILDQPDIAAGVEAAYLGGGIEHLSPVTVPDVPLIIWASADDTRVPTADNAEVCAAQRPDITLIETEGDHAHASNFDAPALLEFFNQRR